MTGTDFEFPVERFRSELRRRGDPHHCPVDLVQLALECRGESWPLSRVIAALVIADFPITFEGALVLVALSRTDTIRKCATACQKIVAEGWDGECWLPTIDHPDAHGTVN